MDLDITDSACRRISELIKLEKEPKVALRVSVDGGGCSGFMYQYILADSINQADLILEKNGIKVIVDPISMEFLKGCVVEFIEELGNSYFQITNPNATAKCGCGNSFAI
jgi:iron-sulfur cluster assembly accessory protein